MATSCTLSTGCTPELWQDKKIDSRMTHYSQANAVDVWVHHVPGPKALQHQTPQSRGSCPWQQGRRIRIARFNLEPVGCLVVYLYHHCSQCPKPRVRNWTQSRGYPDSNPRPVGLQLIRLSRAGGQDQQPIQPW